MEWCELSNQWLYMSAYFDRNRDQYIDHLFAVSAEGAWASWIEFCLRGVVLEARDTERRCDHLLALRRSFKERITKVGGSYRLQDIAEGLLVLPVIRIPQIARKFDVTYPTAKADVERLMTAGILQELEKAAQKTFYSPEIVEITYAELA
jgi:Fic family protein